MGFRAEGLRPSLEPMACVIVRGGSLTYSRSLEVGNPIASILKNSVKGIPTLFGLNPVSNFMGFTVEVGG